VIRFKMRLVEHLIEEASGDFTVEAETPAQAAGILLQAHDTAREADRNLVTLPDGQARNIEPDDVVGNRVFCLLLDEEGDEIGGEIMPDWGYLRHSQNQMKRPACPPPVPPPAWRCSHDEAIRSASSRRRRG